MDRILIILKKEENGLRASSAPALGLNTIIFKHVYWYMQISGERLQDHWSSCFMYFLYAKRIAPDGTPHSVFLSEACYHVTPGEIMSFGVSPVNYSDSDSDQYMAHINFTSN